MRFVMAQVTEPFIEALLIGSAGSACQTEAPFADDSIGISSPLQEVSHGPVLRLERNVTIAADASVASVQPGHEGGAGRGADRAARIALSEAHAFGGQAVNVGSFDPRLAVAAEVAI